MVESVNLSKKMITIHMIFVVSVCIIFGGMNMISEGGFFVGLGIAASGIIVAGVLIVLGEKFTLLTKGMILSTVQLLLLIVASILRHELHGMFPLMLASVSVAAIYFDKCNLIIQLTLIDAASLIGIFFKDFVYGGMDIVFIIKGILGVNVGTFIIFYLVKCCLLHIAEATAAKKNADRLLGQIKSKSEETEKLAEAQNGVVTKIAMISQIVNSSSDEMLKIADRLSSTAETQMTTISEITEAIGSINAQTENSLSESERAYLLAKESAELLDDGNNEVNRMADAMTKIEESSSQISSIVKTVEDIAFQTNILALNASIEAARAGAAGQGFAVVAEEVRTLAEKSSSAVNNTSGLIAASMKAVDEGKQIADRVMQKMQNVMDKSEQSARRSEVISRLTKEQAKSLVSVKARMDQISQVVSQNTEVSEESAQIAEQVADGARRMEEIAKAFRTA